MKTEICVQGKSATHRAIYGEIKDNITQALRIFGDFSSMAKKFIEIQPLYYDKNKLWWIWNIQNLRWEHVDEIEILNIFDSAMKVYGTTSTQVKNEIIEALKREARKLNPETPKPTWIQFKDKIVDVETSKEICPSSLYFITNPIPWDLGESDETPTIDKLFIEWVGSDYVPLLYEIIAYCMIADYPLHRIFCFLGAGMNGKSCYLELIKRFIGGDNTTSTELETLMGSRFEASKLYKKLVCFMGETNFNQMKQTSLIKKLSGGDMIGYEYKGKNPFDGSNYAKLLIATNNLPSTTDKTTGFYRRWIIVDFPQEFNEKKDVLGDIPEIEFSNLGMKCIPIIHRLLNKREFTNEGTIEERAKRFEDKSNPLNKFLEENTEQDWDSFIFKHEFRKVLDEWCSENNFRKIGDQEIQKKFKGRCREIKKQADWFTDEGKKPFLRAWEGIKWKKIV